MKLDANRGIKHQHLNKDMQRSFFSLLLVSLVALPACTKNERPDARVVVTTASFDQLIKDSKKPIVLDLWAPWCGPCKIMDPVFAELSVERPDVVFGKVNVDEEPKLAQKYEIRAIPTMLVVVDGKVVKTSVGVLKKEALLQLLDAAIKKSPQPATPSDRQPNVSRPTKAGGFTYTGGDGSTIDQAVVIKGATDEETGVKAEYTWLRQKYPGYHRGGQSLMGKQGRHYDKIEFTTVDGHSLSTYFDITDFFGK